MKTLRIKNALKKYIPHGLCAGVLVKENGSPKETVGCVIGCLAIDALENLSNKEFFRILDDNNYKYGYNDASDVRKSIIHGELKERGDLADCTSIPINNVILKRFGLNDDDIANLMEYNDEVNVDQDFMTDKDIKKMKNDYSNYDDNYFDYIEHLKIPESLRYLIYKLRKKYDKYLAA